MFFLFVHIYKEGIFLGIYATLHGDASLNSFINEDLKL